LSYGLDLVALIASFVALYFIVRAKKTYFLDSGFFIGLANVGFIAYLAEATYSDAVGVPVLPFFDSILVAIMAASVGLASYLLSSGDPENPGGITEMKKFVSKMPRQFLLFLSVILAWTLSALVAQPWMLRQITIAGSTYFYYDYPNWFVGVSLLLLVSFVALPVLSFYQHSRLVRERTASMSMKIISVCWIMFAVSLFFQIAEGGLLLPTSQSVGYVGDSLLFVLIAFALREPTILARIITGGETVSQVISTHSGDDTIVLYNTESDRRRLIETFIKDGLLTGQKIVCRVTKTEVPFYRAVLKGPELQEFSDGRQAVRIEPLELGFTPQAAGLSERTDSRNDREMVDLDELDFEHARDIIDSLVGSDSLTGRSRIGRIWALNVEGAQAGIRELLMSKSPKSRMIDLAKQQDAFSDLLGLKHDAILGSRLLLEYDPTSAYEDLVQKFVREFQANVKPVAVFTNAGSPLYRQFSGQRNVRLFSFSTKTSSPARLSDEQVLLPERDTSLLLDAVDKLLQADSGRDVGIVFEVFTYLILSLGFEKAYGVISSVVEMSESHSATVLVLINPEALEPRVLSGVRGLFQSQLRFNLEGLTTVRLERGEQGTDHRAPEPFAGEEESPREVQT
jgi:hypothetical protein